MSWQVSSVSAQPPARTSADACSQLKSPVALLARIIAFFWIISVTVMSTNAIANEGEPCEDCPVELPPVEVVGTPPDDDDVSPPFAPGLGGPGPINPPFLPGTGSGGSDSGSDDGGEEDDCTQTANQARQECVNVYTGIWQDMCNVAGGTVGIATARIYGEILGSIFGMSISIVGADFCRTGADNGVAWCNAQADAMIARNCQ